MNIRTAEKSDYPRLIDLFHEFAAYERRADRMFNTAERMEEEQDFFNCFVVETVDHQIVGYLSYFFCYFTWSGKSIYMDDLYVQPGYRGQNIGKKLIDKVVELGKEKGCYKLRWQVSKWNKAAIKIYEKMGADIEDIELDCEIVL